MTERNVPRLRFPGFESTWEQKKVGDISTVSAGATPSTTNRKLWHGSIPWMNSGELNLKRINDVENRITELGLKSSSTKVIPKNCILIGLAGQGKTRGTVAMNMIELCTNQSIAAIWPNRTVFDPEYLYHNLDNRYDELRGLSKGDGGRGGLNLQIIKGMDIVLPPIEEQSKIAGFISMIETQLNNLKKKKSLLEQYKKGMMQKIFNRELRFKDDDGKEFGEWEDILGGDLFESISNKNHNSDLPILAITQEHGAIPRDQIDFNITVSDKSIDSYKIVEKGDFIISLRSFQGGIEYSNYKGICSPAYIILRLSRDYDARYFKYYLKTENYIQLLNSNLEGIRDGKMISYKYFSEYAISCPTSVKEQTKIANLLSAIDDKINLVSQHIEKVEVWKKGLLREMFV